MEWSSNTPAPRRPARLVGDSASVRFTTSLWRAVTIEQGRAIQLGRIKRLVRCEPLELPNVETKAASDSPKAIAPGHTQVNFDFRPRRRRSDMTKKKEPRNLLIENRRGYVVIKIVVAIGKDQREGRAQLLG